MAEETPPKYIKPRGVPADELLSSNTAGSPIEPPEEFTPPQPTQPPAEPEPRSGEIIPHNIAEKAIAREEKKEKREEKKKKREDAKKKKGQEEKKPESEKDIREAKIELLLGIIFISIALGLVAARVLDALESRNIVPKPVIQVIEKLDLSLPRK